MKKIIIITFSIFLGCKNNNEAIITPTFGILIHGGAGTILKKNMSSAKDTEYRNILKELKEKKIDFYFTELNPTILKIFLTMYRIKSNKKMYKKKMMSQNLTE